MKVAFCPSRILPMSASSTFTWRSIRVRSSARLKSTGAWKAAATVCPGSTLRTRTMPLIGERITALARSVSFASRTARAWETAAAALAASAWARAKAASAASTSACEESLPPLISRAFLSCASFARVSVTVAWVCRTFACADSSAALDWVIVASSFEVSSRARTCPTLTRLL